MSNKFVLSLLGAASLWMSFDIIVRSNGAPVSSTAAPGETSCAVSGCHDDREIESGNAIVHIDLNNDATEFVPGNTYPVKVTVSDDNKVRFGFQIVALYDDGSNAGDFIVTDEVRTQSMFNHLELTDREYLTYTYEGTSAINTGYNEWTFNWKAGDRMEPVTFYAAVVSADDDGTDNNDIVYFKELRADAVATSISDLENQSITFNTVVDNHLIIQHGETIKGQIVSLNGQVVKSFHSEQKEGSLKIDCNQLSAGVYILQVNDQSVKILKK